MCTRSGCFWKFTGNHAFDFAQYCLSPVQEVRKQIPVVARDSDEPKLYQTVSSWKQPAS